MPVPNCSRTSLIRIAIADDHNLYRQALVKQIDTWHNCKVTHQAANGAEIVQMLRCEHLPDLLITDLAMPEMNGYELIRWVKETFPSIKIMVVSMYDSQEMLWQVIACGADAFVSKTTEGSQFQTAINEIMQTGYFFSDRMAAQFIRHASCRQSITAAGYFTQEEVHFLKLCCSGATYQEMGVTLSKSPRQIDYLREMMFEKMDACSRSDLAIKARETGLIL